METSDYVIIGGGSAGCVLANRLSEDPACTVLLIEAGGPSDGFLFRMPTGSYTKLGKPQVDWMHMTEPDPTRGGRQVMWNGGRVLGGGSAINGMVYVRGERREFDAWADAGCPGWGWEDVLPYFKRSEDFRGPGMPSHGRGGPLAVSPLRATHPITRAFVEACAQSGVRRLADYCAGDHGRHLPDGLGRGRGGRPAPAGARGGGLRVADAAAMPLLNSANTNAPVMMLAERAADLIRGRTPAAR